MAYDTTRLAQLGKRMQRLREQEAELRPDLNAEILAALAAGVKQADVARIVGYTRDAIRQLVKRTAGDHERTSGTLPS